MTRLALAASAVAAAAILGRAYLTRRKVPPPKTKQTHVIIGTSSGLGLELVRQLAARGDKVYATVRSRKCSASGVDHVSSVPGEVVVVEGIDITDDKVGALLAAALKGVTIDCLFINAGSFNGTREFQGSPAGTLFADQKMDGVSMARMRAALEINTLGPLKVAQALEPQLASPGGKIAVMSTGLGSISDNGSGGSYAYRTSKAGVNMLTKCLAMDLKKKGICVCAIAPGFVTTEFGAGLAAMAKMGAAKVEDGARGCVDVLDLMWDMDVTGSFYRGDYGKGPKIMEW